MKVLLILLFMFPQTSFCFFVSGFESVEVNKSCQLFSDSRLQSVVWGTRNNFPISGITYEQIFGSWPGDGASYLLVVESRSFFSLPFYVMGDEKAVSSIIWEDSTTGSDGWIVSVSVCNGGLMTPVQKECLKETGRTGGILVFANDTSVCRLTPGDYWLNVYPITQNTPTTWLSTAK